MFIALEGGDGVGKTTQIPLIKEWLEKQGRVVRLFREPGSTPLGERIRAILLNSMNLEICRMSELLLFMAARAQMVQECVRPALERGDVVIADRFLLSSIVYQGYGGELDVEQIREVGKIAVAGVLPDCTIILDVPLEVSKARRGNSPDRMEALPDGFHERVRAGFLTEAQLSPQNHFVINANQDIFAVQESIQKTLVPFLNIPN